jgi:hypothetical protein
MQFIEEMLTHTPTRFAVDEKFLATCVEALLSCQIACTSCADACLAEDDVAGLRHCIRLNLDCAGICGMTGTMLSRLVAADKDLFKV